MKDKTTILIPKPLSNKIRAIARRNDRSVSGEARIALEQYVARHEPKQKSK